MFVVLVSGLRKAYNIRRFATWKTEARESRALSRNCNRIRIRVDQWGQVALRRMRRRLEAGSQETLHAVCMNLRMKGKVQT